MIQNALFPAWIDVLELSQLGFQNAATPMLQKIYDLHQQDILLFTIIGFVFVHCFVIVLLEHCVRHKILISQKIAVEFVWTVLSYASFLLKVLIECVTRLRGRLNCFLNYTTKKVPFALSRPKIGFYFTPIGLISESTTFLKKALPKRKISLMHKFLTSIKYRLLCFRLWSLTPIGYLVLFFFFTLSQLCFMQIAYADDYSRKADGLPQAIEDTIDKETLKKTVKQIEEQLEATKKELKRIIGHNPSAFTGEFTSDEAVHFCIEKSKQLFVQYSGIPQHDLIWNEFIWPQLREDLYDDEDMLRKVAYFYCNCEPDGTNFNIPPQFEKGFGAVVIYTVVEYLKLKLAAVIIG